MVASARIAAGLLPALLLVACGDDGRVAADAITCEAGCPPEACASDGVCLSRPCDEPGTCDDGFFCDAATGWCRLGCEPAEPCADGRVCDAADHTCRACDEAHACPDGSGACTDGRCVECTRDADCGLGLGLYCLAASSHCVTGCTLQEHCPPSLVCDVAGTRCVQCARDADCAGARCMIDEGRCVECIADPGCGVGAQRYCDTATNACLPGCLSDISCPVGTRCAIEERLCR